MLQAVRHHAGVLAVDPRSTLDTRDVTEALRPLTATARGAAVKTGRIVRSTDFERVLRRPPRAKSPHFALHHLQDEPSRFVRKAKPSVIDNTIAAPASGELSTASGPDMSVLVDDSPLVTHEVLGSMPVASVIPVGPAATMGCWLGTVVPKRHARRSVTRSLMKRQMHAAFEREASLPSGLWVVRLRSPFDVKRFTSASSELLRRAVRAELDSMLAGLVRRLDSTERIA